jgi:hypothetical protein
MLGDTNDPMVLRVREPERQKPNWYVPAKIILGGFFFACTLYLWKRQSDDLEMHLARLRKNT